MSEKMRPMPFGAFMEYILSEYSSQGTIFGVESVYKALPGRALPMFGRMIETPFGPAAGPNTQLKQNIVASYAAGARFFELKTVQIMDGEELAKCINRPCILAYDEGYNCEWSTELTVPEAFSEYVGAYIALELIAMEFNLGSPGGFVFNMSVGYDLEGIKSKKIDDFIEGLKDASSTAVWKECMAWVKENMGKFRNITPESLNAISPVICDSITLSTLHGCPPDEIERIAEYLISEKKLNTFVKCNPTLLGYDFARETLDALGYDYIVFDDFHFNDDLQYRDAVPMFKRLSYLANANGLSFGVKLTNTFPVTVAAGELPAEEMYMSGRSIFPLTAELARRLTVEFDGKLRISYSGGADAFSAGALFDAGIWPITMATTILKPGGYNRFRQLSKIFACRLYESFECVNADAITGIAKGALSDVRYKKPIKPRPDVRIPGKAPLLDCFEARCRNGCPFGQDIPLYLRLYNEGRFDEALEVILEKNPLPNITGTICSHPCMVHCTRNFYDLPVNIRGVKLECAETAWASAAAHLRRLPENGRKAAVAGGGPAGLASAYFLARAGFKVTLFEKSEKLGGAVRHVIPGFRISDEAIERDAELIKALGVEILTGTEMPPVSELKNDGYDTVVLAFGAWKPGVLQLRYGRYTGALEFLDAAKNAPETLSVGKNVVVIGAGNTAMDTARAAKRLPGVERVSIIYRRTKRYMPADGDELELAVSEGIELLELLSPIGHADGKLTCRVMVLGDPDASGRRTPVETEATVDIPADTVIAAVGEGVDASYYKENGIALDSRSMPVVSADTLESSVSGVYIVGDGRTGPKTVAEAIADALKASRAVTGEGFDKFDAENAEGSIGNAISRKGVLCTTCPEGQRCLECATICECCVDVCPNRANVSLEVNGRRQIIHIEDFCNECGNCAVFCPYDSKPYKDKLTLFSSAEDLNASSNEGFCFLGVDRVLIRYNGKTSEHDINALPAPLGEVIRTAEEKLSLLI